MHRLGHIPPPSFPSPRRAKLRRLVVLAASLVLMLGLAVLAARSIDLAAVGASLEGADPTLMAVAVLLYAAGQTASGLMWAVCQRAGGVRGMPGHHAVGLHWISRGACEALPASLGEAVRVGVVRRHPAGVMAGTWRIVGGLGAYKLLDAAVTGLAVLGIAVLAPPPGPAGDLRWVALGALGVGVLAVLAARRGAGRMVVRRLPARLGRSLSRLGEGVRGIGEPSTAFTGTGFGALAVLLRIGSLAALLAALGLPAGAAPMVFALIVVSGLLPLAPGGAGAREALLVPALALAHGVPAASALAMSVTVQAVALGTSLVLGAGALAWLGPAVLRDRGTVARPVAIREALADA